jgi:glycosyltransferase involved in cell wall biosynthesis
MIETDATALAAVVSPWYVRSLYEGAFVPGQRQVRFARILGFNYEGIRIGLYSCDHSAFADSREKRVARGGPLPRKFLFSGRLSPDKGLESLLSAYRIYRASTRDPWPLVIAGAGPLRETAEREAGVEYRGFVQPENQPQLLGDAGCLVLPSRFEPWGVVINEATAAGLPIICTRECGAAEHLVVSSVNGFTVNRNSPRELAGRLVEFSSLSDDRRNQMGNRSFELSSQFTPRKWAGTVMELFDRPRRNPLNADAARDVEFSDAR